MCGLQVNGLWLVLVRNLIRAYCSARSVVQGAPAISNELHGTVERGPNSDLG